MREIRPAIVYDPNAPLLEGQIRFKWLCKYCGFENRSRLWKKDIGQTVMNTCNNLSCSRNNFHVVKPRKKSKGK